MMDALVITLIAFNTKDDNNNVHGNADDGHNSKMTPSTPLHCHLQHSLCPIPTPDGFLSLSLSLLVFFSCTLTTQLGFFYKNMCFHPNYLFLVLIQTEPPPHFLCLCVPLFGFSNQKSMRGCCNVGMYVHMYVVDNLNT